MASFTKDDLTKGIAKNATDITALQAEIKTKQAELTAKNTAQITMNTALEALKDSGQAEVTDEALQFASDYAGTPVTLQTITDMHDIITAAG